MHTTQCRAKWLTWVTGAVVLLWSATAVAQWDPASFGKTLGEAEQAYLAGNYADAGLKYAQLRGMLGEALSTGAIPAKQQPRANETMLVIAYQLARCHQQTGDCESAGDVYDELLSGENLAEDLRAKLLVRGAESRVCLAESAIATGDAESARRHLDKAGQQMADAAAKPFAEVLSPEQATELQAVIEQTTAKKAALEEQRKGIFVARVETAIRAKDCPGGEAGLAGLPSEGIDPAEQARLRGELDVACAPVEPEPEGMDLSYVALGVAGVGGALILTAVVLEVVASGDIDDFDAARTECLDGAAENCQTALDLKSDIESQQVVTGVLLGVGTAALVGGMVWWLLTEDGAAGEVEVMLTPAIGADSVVTNLTIRW